MSAWRIRRSDGAEISVDGWGRFVWLRPGYEGLDFPTKEEAEFVSSGGMMKADADSARERGLTWEVIEHL